MAVTFAGFDRRAIQNPAYRPADTSQRGLGGNTAGPPPILHEADQAERAFFWPSA
jgi:hypothetical protein